jgi:hypothetical protein
LRLLAVLWSAGTTGRFKEVVVVVAEDAPVGELEGAACRELIMLPPLLFLAVTTLSAARAMRGSVAELQDIMEDDDGTGATACVLCWACKILARTNVSKSIEEGTEDGAARSVEEAVFKRDRAERGAAAGGGARGAGGAVEAS